MNVVKLQCVNNTARRPFKFGFGYGRKRAFAVVASSHLGAAVGLALR